MTITINAIEKEKSEIVDRIKFFQNVHVLPLNEDFNYHGWLSNFDKSEEHFALLLLNFFTYYNSKMIDHLIISAVQNSLSHLSSKFRNWNHNNDLNNCVFSYFPGEESNITDSGIFFTRRIRQLFGIDESNIISFDDLFRNLSMRTKRTHIVFIDDFVGSGNQCDVAWNRKLQFNGDSLSNMASSKKWEFVFSPLIANLKGYQRIIKNCSNLNFVPVHIIKEEYNIFSSICPIWKKDPTLYQEGTTFIKEVSKKLSIPDSSGTEEIDYKGYYQQGLALSFSHGCPDATIPLFYWNENNWTPLINKITIYEYIR